VHEVPSGKDAGVVTAQDPPPGTLVKEWTKVRINVSKGPQPVSVPDVRGQPFDTANSQLQGLGFQVTSTFVESTEPANTVIDQSPGAGSSAAKGSTIAVTVSKGPTTSTVPDVTSLDVESAQQTLEDSGFKPRVAFQDVSDPSQDGIVLSQDPGGGSQAKPGARVTVTVGRLVSQPPTETTTTPSP
jgi:serine/threonine-protein kinase